ncbi:MAG TPA: hypothetical protein VLT15_02980 [Acidimicrobiia bacterium]|nr:hypothetical protein [Acidimicrobiia bacterium]
MKHVYQSPDLKSRALWAGGFVVLVIVGFSIFTPTLGRRVGLWVVAVAVIAYFRLMASSRVEVDGSDVTVINYARRRRVRREDIIECGMDTRPLVGPVGRLRMRDGSSIYLYGLQPRREAGDDTLRSDELAALALSIGSGGPMRPS